MNKIAYSLGFTWVFVLITLFSLGLLYIVFDEVFDAYLVPTIKNQANESNLINDTDKNMIYGEIDKYMDFWDFVPLILIFVVVTYAFVSAFRKERDSEYL